MEPVDFNNAPQGATHRYDHACTTAWYREVDGKLFVWRDGRWHAGVSKSIPELAESCMLGKLTSLVEEDAEPAEDDLTWLVRDSRGEWFGSHPTHIARDGDLLTWATFPRLPEGYQWFTKEQYLARKAELQNKPSWNDAPEWATLLAQDSVAEDGLGAWWWYEAAPTECERTWSHQVRAYPAQFKGEVLGDWRDTLERRPQLTAEDQTVLAAQDMLIGRRTGSGNPVDASGTFDEFSERQKVKRNDWFERGELPPVGAVCEHVGPVTGKIQRAVVVAVHHFTGEAIWSHRENGGRLFYGMRGCFRPIRTGRELAIDEMKQHCPHHGSWGSVGRIYAEALYDAGYRAGGAA